MSSDVELWAPKEEEISLRGLKNPEEVTRLAKQLTPREIKQVVSGFASGHFEMAISFVWSKAMNSLKQRLGSLGGDFVGEMLDRPDLKGADNLVHSVSDVEALRLGERLGMFTSSQSVRLRNTMRLVQHFTNLPDDADADDGLQEEEAVSCLKASVQAILGHERLDVAVEFAEFRASLEDRVLPPNSPELVSLAASPYFFRRTTLRVLLALLKHGAGIQLENAAGNFSVVLPALWEGLLKSDRWDVGRSYAEVHAAGRNTAAAGIRRALLKVRGFDYVPENLRSLSFISAANAILEAHYGFSNFHNEPRPMKALADMGAIPSPALARCVTAALCVVLGNYYGRSWAAQEYGDSVLLSLSQERWVYYLQDVLPGEEDVLDKLEHEKPREHWFDLVSAHSLGSLPVVDFSVASLLKASAVRSAKDVEVAVQRIRSQNRRESR